MPETIEISRQDPFAIGVRIALLLFTTLAAIHHAPGQTLNREPQINVKQSLGELLPSHLGENWKAIGGIRILNREQFSVLPDADVYGEYGLQTITIRDFTNGRIRYTVEIFQMAFTSGAYGLFTFHRRALEPNRKELHQGRYLVSIFADQAISELDQSLIDAIDQNLPTEDSGEMPSLPLHLPDQHKIIGNEIYLTGPLALARIDNVGELKDAVIFTGGAEAVTARYTNGNGEMELLLVEYHTPQLATDGFAKLQSHFEALPQSEKEKRLLTRIGNYVVEALNIRDKPSAQNIIGQIKYTPRVYWEGRKPSDIPLQFRPPDPAAIEEALQTANVLIRTFYWIGVMLTSAIVLGIVAGSSVFYWRRYRRRKKGLENLFSDAGGTIRLNLDEFLLTSSEQHIKRIGKRAEED